MFRASVISEATRQRVSRLQKKLNYHPDSSEKSLPAGRSNTSAWSFGRAMNRCLPMHLLPSIVGIEQAVTEQGFQFLLKPLEPGILTVIWPVMRTMWMALFSLGRARKKPRSSGCIGKDCRFMLMGQLPGSGLPFVDIDAVHGSITAVNHLSTKPRPHRPDHQCCPGIHFCPTAPASDT